jgi:hypothetical protein
MLPTLPSQHIGNIRQYLTETTRKTRKSGTSVNSRPIIRRFILKRDTVVRPFIVVQRPNEEE